jgi:hypothetical protein
MSPPYIGLLAESRTCYNITSFMLDNQSKQLNLRGLLGRGIGAGQLGIAILRHEK